MNLPTIFMKALGTWSDMRNNEFYKCGGVEWSERYAWTNNMVNYVEFAICATIPGKFYGEHQ